MNDDPQVLVRRHYRRGVLVDTQLLVLFLVGKLGLQNVTSHSRTKAYTKEDYKLLVRLLARFAKLISTTAILTETSNLLGQSGEPARSRLMGLLRMQVETVKERHVPSKQAAKTPAFDRLGLTDSVIEHVARNRVLVLTDDFPLAVHLISQRCDVLNFTNLRPLNWI